VSQFNAYSATGGIAPISTFGPFAVREKGLRKPLASGWTCEVGINRKSNYEHER